MPGHLLHLWNLTVKDVLRNYAEKNWPFSFQISSEDAMATSEQKNPSGSLSSWRNCTSLWVRFLWHSRKNYMDSQLCLDMQWYGDKCWCADPASYAACPSEWLLEQITLIQLFGPATDVITGKKKFIDGRNVSKHCQKILTDKTFATPT